jgi:hypothetical protein
MHFLSEHFYFIIKHLSSFKLRKIDLLTYGAEPFLRRCQLCSHSGTSQHFKEPEGSSQCSQEPSTGPYPETDWSSPYHPISLRSILMSIHLRLGLPSGLFPSGFPTNILYAFSVNSWSIEEEEEEGVVFTTQMRQKKNSAKMDFSKKPAS